MQASPIVLTTLAGLSTGLGGVLAALAKPSETMLAASAGFAGGVMLTASLADLMPEALEFYSGYLQPLPCGGAIITLLALGMLTAGLLGRLLPEETELAAKYGQNTARTKAMRTALITGTALLLHNFPEGVLTLFAGTADPALGLRTALAIALHNIPEGLAVAVPFAYATNSRAKGALRSGRTGGSPGGTVFVPQPVHTRIFDRHDGAGGRHYDLGRPGPTAAHGLRPGPPPARHFRCRRRLPAHAPGHCGFAVNVLYYTLY